jgi:hypothetical protein
VGRERGGHARKRARALSSSLSPCPIHLPSTHPSPSFCLSTLPSFLAWNGPLAATLFWSCSNTTFARARAQTRPPASTRARASIRARGRREPARRNARARVRACASRQSAGQQPPPLPPCGLGQEWAGFSFPRGRSSWLRFRVLKFLAPAPSRFLVPAPSPQVPSSGSESNPSPRAPSSQSESSRVLAGPMSKVPPLVQAPERGPGGSRGGCKCGQEGGSSGGGPGEGRTAGEGEKGRSSDGLGRGGGGAGGERVRADRRGRGGSPGRRAVCCGRRAWGSQT